MVGAKKRYDSVATSSARPREAFTILERTVGRVEKKRRMAGGRGAGFSLLHVVCYKQPAAVLSDGWTDATKKCIEIGGNLRHSTRERTRMLW